MPLCVTIRLDCRIKYHYVADKKLKIALRIKSAKVSVSEYTYASRNPGVIPSNIYRRRGRCSQRIDKEPFFKSTVSFVQALSCLSSTFYAEMRQATCFKVSFAFRKKTISKQPKVNNFESASVSNVLTSTSLLQIYIRRPLHYGSLFFSILRSFLRSRHKCVENFHAEIRAAIYVIRRDTKVVFHRLVFVHVYFNIAQWKITGSKFKRDASRHSSQIRKFVGLTVVIFQAVEASVRCCIKYSPERISNVVESSNNVVITRYYFARVSATQTISISNISFNFSKIFTTLLQNSRMCYGRKGTKIGIFLKKCHHFYKCYQIEPN